MLKYYISYGASKVHFTSDIHQTTKPVRGSPVKLYSIKDVRAPGVIAPWIVRVAPYITTTIIDRVDAAFKLPEKRPTTFCRRKHKISGFPSHPLAISLILSPFFSCQRWKN